MNETLIAGLRASARDLRTAGEALLSGVGRLEALVRALEQADQEAAKTTGGTLYKKPNGRMTDAGAAAIDAAYSAGATVTEVAQQFGIHTSAASYRYARWQEAQEQKKEKETA